MVGVSSKSAAVCLRIVFVLVIVSCPVKFFVLTPLLAIQYDRCRALPAGYNYVTKFGLEVYTLLASVALYLSSHLLFCLSSRGMSNWKKTRNFILLSITLLSASCLGTVMAATVFREMDESKMRLTQSIIEYGNASLEIDSIQSSFRCCGVDGPESWQLNWKFNCSSGRSVCGVPQSCCIDQTNMTCGFDVWKNETLSANVLEDGCLSILEECLIDSTFWGLYLILLSGLMNCTLSVWFRRQTQYMASVQLVWKALTCCCIRAPCQDTSRTMTENRNKIQSNIKQTSSKSDPKQTIMDSMSTFSKFHVARFEDQIAGDAKSNETFSRRSQITTDPAYSKAEGKENLVSSEDLEMKPRDTMFSLSRTPIATCTIESRAPVEQLLELERLHGCSAVQLEIKVSGEENPKSDVQSGPDQIVYSMETAIDENEKKVLITATESTQSSTNFMSGEDDSEVLPIGELLLTVGPDGGHAHRGDLSLFVPVGAVDRKVTLVAKQYTNKHKFPQVDVSKEEFIFSPVLSLEPHGYQFKLPVLVRCPFSAMPGGWLLSLLRADCKTQQVAKTWKEIITYNTDTDEVTTDDCQFDFDHALLGVTHFCDHCWCGKPILADGLASSLKLQKQLYCSVFGYQPDSNWNRWLLELYLHDRCDDIYEEVLSRQKTLSPSRQLLGVPKVLTIARSGDIIFEVNSRSWVLEEEIKPQLSKYYWTELFDNRHTIEFAVYLPSELSARVYEIKIKVQGCEDTAPATYSVCLINHSRNRQSLAASVTDSDTHSEVGSPGGLRQLHANSPTSFPPATSHQSPVTLPEQDQASASQPFGEYKVEVVHVLKATPEDKHGIFPEAEQHERGSTTQTGTPERTDICTATVDEGKQTLDMEVTEEQLVEVARVGKDKWRLIGAKLGFDFSDLQGYKEEHRMSDRLYAILSDWKRKVDHPTARVLLQACKKAGIGGIVKKILGIQGKWSFRRFH